MYHRKHPYKSLRIQNSPARNKGLRTHSPSSQKRPRDNAQWHCARAATGSSAPAQPEQEDVGRGMESGKGRMESLSSSSSFGTSPSAAALLQGSPPPHDSQGEASEDATRRKIRHRISSPLAAPRVHSQEKTINFAETLMYLTLT